MLNFTSLITAILLLCAECRIDCYTCVAEEQVLKDQYISEECIVKEKCHHKNYCLAMTWKYNELSFQKRGCIESDKDYPCNRLWSNCKREVCAKNYCNSASRQRHSIIFITTALLIFVLLT